ncbi:MAG: SH3 domain-containing protein [Anaerolineae bacterium]|jgi:hypothetical protein
MFRTRRFWLLMVLLLLAALLAACGPAATPTPEPTPTRPARPTFTPTVIPTDTPVLTPTSLPTETPIPLPTDTPTPAAPKAIIGGDGQVNVRSGPGTAYAEAGQVATGTELEIVSSNAAGDWYEVCCVDGQNVWVVARLVEVTGDAGLIQVASNIPAPPTATPAPTRPPVVVQPPAQPTQPPAPTAPPAPTFRFAKRSMEPRPNTNPLVSVFGGLYNAALDLNSPVTGYKLVVQAPSGQQHEMEFGPAFLRGDAGYPSEFLFNAKIEIPLSEGTFRAWVADPGGNQVSEAYDLPVAGETRTFIVRWQEQ